MMCSIHDEDESQIKAHGRAQSSLFQKSDKEFTYGRGYILATKRGYKGWGGMGQQEKGPLTHVDPINLPPG